MSKGGTKREPELQRGDHEQKYFNMFQHQFSKSPHCLFEFAFDANESKVSKVYNLRQIIPNHIWQSIDVDAVLAAWSECDGFETLEFIRRCIGFKERVQQKTRAEAWVVESNALFVRSLCSLFQICAESASTHWATVKSEKKWKIRWREGQKCALLALCCCWRWIADSEKYKLRQSGILQRICSFIACLVAQVMKTK